MDRRQVVFGSFLLLAASLNLAFFLGEVTDPSLHDVRVLFAALAVNLAATGMKIGDRTQVGAVHLATSLVVSASLVAAVLVWAVARLTVGHVGAVTPPVVALSGGALLASIASVTMLIYETAIGGIQRR